MIYQETREKNRKWRFAILGCGRIAPYHAKAIKSLRNTKIIVVCDIVPGKAEDFARKYKAKAYLDYKKMLREQNIDIVNIATPNHLHSEMGIYAAQLGIHVICEKPLSTNTKDALRLIKACKKYKVKLSCCFQNRYNKPIRELKQLLQKKALGKVYLASVVVRWMRTQEYYNDPWHGKLRLAGGGALMTQAVHHVDLLQYLLGMPQKVFAYSGTQKYKAEVEDTLVGVLKYKNGSFVTLEATTVTVPKNLEASITILAEKGSVKIGGKFVNQKDFWFTPYQKLEKPVECKTRSEDLYGTNHREIFKKMINAIIHNKTPSINGREAIKSLKIVEALYKSAVTGQEKKV